MSLQPAIEGWIPVNLGRAKEGQIVAAFGRKRSTDARQLLDHWPLVAAAARSMAGIALIGAESDSVRRERRLRIKEVAALANQLRTTAVSLNAVVRQCERQSQIRPEYERGVFEVLGQWATVTRDATADRYLQVAARRTVEKLQADKPRKKGAPHRWAAESCLLEALAIYFKRNRWTVGTTKHGLFAKTVRAILGTVSVNHRRLSLLRDMKVVEVIFPEDSSGGLGKTYADYIGRLSRLDLPTPQESRSYLLWTYFNQKIGPANQ